MRHPVVLVREQVQPMIGPLLTGVGKAIYWGLGAVQAAGELLGATRSMVNAARRGRIPHSPEEKRQLELNAKGPQSPKMR
jgi:hypothetical protein